MDKELLMFLLKMYNYVTEMKESRKFELEQELTASLTELFEIYEQEKEIEQDNSTPIYELDLSVRSANLLDKGGIKTIEDLENATFDYISHLRNMGYKSLREIYTALIEWKEKHRRK